MSLWETGGSSGAVSLKKLFEGESVSCLPESQPGLRDVASAICTGGWPRHLGQSEEDALLSADDYVNEIIRVDIPAASGVRHDPTMLRRLMQSLSRNVATEAKMTKLASDIDAGHPPGRNTVSAYLDALHRIFVIEDQPAWSVNLRSKATLRREPKRHLVDPSLAAAMLRTTPERLLAGPVSADVVVTGSGEGQRYDITDAPQTAFRRQLSGLDEPFSAAEYVVAPGSRLGGFFASEGREMIHVTRGMLAVDLEDGDGGTVTHRLAAGDTMIYSTATRHRWHHLGSETTRFVHVCAPG